MLEVWIDGACEPINPGGIASYGLVVKKETSYLYKESKIEGSGKDYSNNVSEYCALLAFINWYSKNIKDNEIATIYSDSQLVVNQMSGRWKIKEGLYKPFAVIAKTEINKKGYRFMFKWIPREKNTEADKLSKEAIIK